MSTLELGSHYYDHPDGRIHYIDEGQGPAVVFVHGTPTSSYLYRTYLRALRSQYRVVALDHLGFGKSDKPFDAAYTPADHARRLRDLLHHLGLRDVTLVLHDFGGPIGLSYAEAEPENVRSLVLFNTWMWRSEEKDKQRVARAVQGAFGVLLYRYLNFSPRVLLKAAFADKHKLTRELHAQYLAPFANAWDRMAPLVLARNLVSPWFDTLWRNRDRISDKPTLILWGMKDPAFKPATLERLRSVFTKVRVRIFPDAGHFVQEEAPEQSLQEMKVFLEETVLRSTKKEKVTHSEAGII